MSNRQLSRVVFVGNIPYGLTEEQITDIFSAAGRVINFRLVYDRETGRPKGFGFAEFPDYDSAASAVRNLDDYEIMGRKLRVDFSNEPASDEDNRDRNRDQAAVGSSNMAPSYANGNVAQQTAAAAGSSLPPLPQGKDLPPGMTCTDAISRTLNTLPPAQLLDTLQQVQSLAIQDPARLTELFNQAPQLTYAIFQAMLLMGLVSPDAINSVLDTSAAAPPPAAPAPGYGYPGATGTPPVAAPAGYAPPPGVPSPIAVVAPAAAAPAQDQDALMKAVMELPQEMVDQLPEAERQQIMQLRATFAMQQRR